MLPLLTHPWALWGLLAVPALAAIYLFRNRFRRHPVSSLLLWAETRERRAGGTRLDRLQTPLLLLLEVLAVVLLVLTAAEAVALLSGWTCKAPAARLDEAITLATELGGELALLLVVTDHEPGRGAVPDRGRVRWWAFGSPRPNFAFVQAVRSSRGGPD